MARGTKDFTAYRNATFTRTLTWKDKDRTAYNLGVTEVHSWRTAEFGRRG